VFTGAVTYIAPHVSAVFDCFWDMMFKLFSRRGITPKVAPESFLLRSKTPETIKTSSTQAFEGLEIYKLLCLLGILLGTLGCQTVSRLPAVDFKQPGWTVLEGQGVWRVKAGAPEIAGEVLLATNGAGRAFVQLTKNPFPLVIAQTTRDSWQIELPAQNKRYSGHGRPPKRMIWFFLPKALLGSSLPKGLSAQVLENNGWRLENRSSGESIEGYFNQ